MNVLDDREAPPMRDVFTACVLQTQNASSLR